MNIPSANNNTSIVPTNNFPTTLQKPIKPSINFDNEEVTLLNKKITRGENSLTESANDPKTIKKPRLSNEVQEYTVPINYVQKQLKQANQVSVVRIITDNINENSLFQKYVSNFKNYCLKVFVHQQRSYYQSLFQICL